MNTNQFSPIPQFTNQYPLPQSNMYMPRNIMPVNNGIIWVQGIEGAKAYQIPQSSNIILMDSEQNRMYIKTSDNIGMCNLRIFDFTEITETSTSNNSIIPQQDMSQFVTRQELEKILTEYNGRVNDEQSIPTIKSNKSGKSTITE